VALSNLEAMCEHVSGTCHRYSVSYVSPGQHWVKVDYSNPDEWGNESPMTAVFPAFRSPWPGDKDNPRVVLTIIRIVRDNWHGEGHQAFEPLLACPALFRNGLDGEWKTREECGSAKWVS